MRLHRFYINQGIGTGKSLRVDDVELLNQWVKVFRLKTSDRVIVFDGSGSEFECYFSLLSKKEAILNIVEKREIKNVPKIDLTIFQSIIKKDNFELIIQKCTEIGVTAFRPIISERSEKKDLNTERLQKIAKEASEQSGKGKLPEIFEPARLENVIENFDGKLFVLDFDGERLDSVLDSTMGILIGPEGGWTDSERELFKQNGIKPISLGVPILRAETAAIAVSALILLK
jgi:16S rRNA (uracil1498-N3)-methyltransferase